MVHSVNDAQLVSMWKDTDGPTVWSHGARNKYDPALCYQKSVDLEYNIAEVTLDILKINGIN